jgi:hypothetical protein
MGKILSFKERNPEYTVRPQPRKKRGSYFLMDADFTRRWMEIFDPCTSSVYMLLCSMANNQTQTCYPAMSTIREKVGASKKQVMRSIRLLEFYELVCIGKERGKPNVYCMTDKNQWKYPVRESGYARPTEFVMLPS